MKFENSYVAFLDILGFKDLMKEKDFKKKIEKYFKLIEGALEKSTKSSSHGIYPASEIKKVVLSDSIILSIPIPKGADWREKFKILRFLLSAVEKVQFSLALEGIWIRGAISEGELCHARGNIVGQGLVNAYLLEGKAKFPRVLVDSIIFQNIYQKPNESKSRSDILTDINNRWGNPKYSGKFIFDWDRARQINEFGQDYPFFVHYLNPLVDEDNSEERAEILSSLAKNLLRNDPDIYRKFRWVSDYVKSMTDGEIARRIEMTWDEDLETQKEFSERSETKFLGEYSKNLSKL